MKLIRGALAVLFLGAALAGMSAQAADGGKEPAAKKEAPKDLVLKGDAKCTGCHDESDEPTPTMLELHPSVLAIGKTRHGVKADGRTPTCTDCHGASEKHLNHKGSDKPPKPDRWFNKKTNTPVEERNNACLACHEKEEKRMHWPGSAHQTRDVACTSCHNIHVDKDKVLSKATQSEVCFSCHKTERAQTQRISTHPLAAGKMACSDCHNPHGSVGPKLMVKETVRDTCFTCHAEKRGPFLWEHASATDDCMNCHTPHGSTNTPLLKGRMPWLCQQCHGDGAPHPGNVYSAANLPGGAVANANRTGAVNSVTGASVTANNPSIQIALRSCTNCHAQIHGSNHPAGQRFIR